MQVQQWFHECNSKHHSERRLSTGNLCQGFRKTLWTFLSSSYDSATSARRFLRYCACACTSAVQNAWRLWASSSAGSVGEAVRLVQLKQQVVADVERGEADPHGDGPLQPVHAQAFVQSTHDPLLSHDRTHGPQDGGVRPSRDAGRLHAPAYHVQRVGGRLSDQACAGAESQALVWVRLGSLCFLYAQKKRQVRVWRAPDNHRKSLRRCVPVCSFLRVSYVKNVIPAYGMTPRMVGANPL